MARVLCAELGHKSFNQMTWAVLKYLDFQSMPHVQHAYMRSQKVSSATTEAIYGHFNLSCDDHPSTSFASEPQHNIFGTETL